MLATLQHPPNQPFQLTIGQRTRIFFDASIRDRRMQQRTNLATEFILQSPYEVGEARAKPRDADGLDGLLPGILIIGGDRKNFFEKHLWREVWRAPPRLHTGFGG